MPTCPVASTQNGVVTCTSMSSPAFWTPGLEILTSILAPFSGSMAGWSTRTSISAQRPVRRAMFAISSRKALCLAERACPHGHVVAVWLPCRGRLRTRFRRASCFCTDFRGRTRVSHSVTHLTATATATATVKATLTATGYWGPPRETHRRREPETFTQWLLPAG